MNDTSLFENLKTRPNSSVVGDVTDVLGLTHQFLPPEIRSLNPDHVMVGRRCRRWKRIARPTG